MNKTWKQMIKETFTKTFDERYAEASKTGRIVYWLFVALVSTIIAAVWLGWL